jgi:CubicO group peptidase (beta-lactamase class C family)
MKALLILLATLSASAQMPPALDAYIEKARADMGVPGIAVTIVRDGKLVVAKGYGVRELGKPERVDADTMFDTASLSKSFTAAAVATLVDEGKMEWDHPVLRHLPGFELSDPYRTGSTTMRDLLAHRVGVEQGNWVFRITNYDTAEVLRRMRFLKVREPFRGGMIYSNIGYSAAAEAAAHAAGMPFSDLVRTRLVEPLGMRASTVGVEHTLAPNHASPHGMVEGVHRPIRNKKAFAILGANAVNSTARDMANWLLFQLGDGTWEGKRIISTAVMREMHSPQIVIPTSPEMRAARGVHFFAGYGLGWQVMDFRGHPMLWHSGSNDGMPVYMAILPADDIGVCVMTNSWVSGVLHGALAARILDTLLGVKEPRDWAGEVIKRQLAEQPPAPPARVENTKPSLPLEAYAGTYEDPVHGSMVVTHADGRLTLQFGGGELADLQHWHYDTFRVLWQDRVYEFVDTLAAFGMDATGRTDRFDMRLNRDVITALRAGR